MSFGDLAARLAETILMNSAPEGKTHHEDSPLMRTSQPPSCFSFVFTEQAQGEWRETYEAISECDRYEQSVLSNDEVPPSIGSRQP